MVEPGTSVAYIQPIILAGGKGSRLARALPGLPKPMAPAAGRPFVEWIVRSLAAAGLKQVIISTEHLGHVIEDHFARDPVPDVEVRCLREEQPLGTAGAMLHAVERSAQTPSAWLVLNGDSLTFVDWPNMVHRFERRRPDGIIVARQVDDVGRFGALRVDDHIHLLAFSEKTVSGVAGLVNAGVYLLGDELVRDCPDTRPLSLEKDLFPGWLRAGRRLEVYPTEAEFLDIGTEESLTMAGDFIRRNQDRFA